MKQSHIAGQLDIVDTAPAIGPILPVATPYGQPETLYANGVGMGDVNQGNIGDCFLLSSLMEVIRKKPQFISNMIHDNGNGTQTVRLYESSNGSLAQWNTTSFKPVYETVNDRTLSPGGVNAVPSQDTVNGVKEIWPQVIEQAYAQLNGGFMSIANGGNPQIAIETLTGRPGSVANGAFNFSMLQRIINAGCTMTFDTLPFGNLTNGLVSNHSYAYLSCNVAGPGGSQTTINLGNPWGFANPTPVPISAVCQEFGAIDLGHVS